MKRSLNIELPLQRAKDADHPAHGIFAGATEESAAEAAPRTNGAGAANKKRKHVAVKAATAATSARVAGRADSDPYHQLLPSDKAVFDHLDKLRRGGDGETCTASIPDIHLACDICERQVQVSTGRLIERKMIEKIGYDFGNPVRTKRGTIYKILYRLA